MIASDFPAFIRLFSGRPRSDTNRVFNYPKIIAVINVAAAFQNDLSRVFN